MSLAPQGPRHATPTLRVLDHDVEVTNLRDLISTQSRLGKKPLLICGEETLTYEDADLQSSRIANQLIGLGVTKGDVVGTLMYNSVAQLLIWFACAKVGAIYAPLNVSLVKTDLTYSLNDIAPKVFVVDTGLLDVYETCLPDLPVRPIEVAHGTGERGPGQRMCFPDLLHGDGSLPDVDVQATDPAAIVYTGGSTSMPKGVLVPHFYYIAAALRYREVVRPLPDDVHYANSHFFHVGGQQLGIAGPLYNGITGVMSRWFSASRYWDEVRRQNVSIIDPLGTMLAALMRQPQSELDREHRVRVGVAIASGQVRRDIRDGFERRFNVPLLEVYSMTELGIMVFSERIDDRRSPSAGRTHGWADVSIVDDQDFPVPSGVVGQILLRPRSPNSSMIRYINKGDETIAAWRSGWYHTGDLGSVDDDGYLYFTGRQAHWIRRRGENVAAFEIEKVLSAHPAVIDCAAVGVPAELGEEDIKVYVHLEAHGANLDPQELIDWCREQIAAFKVPRYVEYVDSLPRTLTKSEVARHDLRDRGVGHAWDREHDGDGNDRRTQLTRRSPPTAAAPDGK